MGNSHLKGFRGVTMKIVLAVLFSAIVASVCGEHCVGTDTSTCTIERCPSHYTLMCQDGVCSCDTAPIRGECQTENDCYSVHGDCDNNDKTWYCNLVGGENRCCCGEPFPHADATVAPPPTARTISTGAPTT